LPWVPWQIGAIGWLVVMVGFQNPPSRCEPRTGIHGSGEARDAAATRH
jgi:hypothetical protein